MGNVYDMEMLEDFSLVCGGPTYRFLLRVGLIGRELHDTRKAAAVLAALTWLPLLVLSAAQGSAISGIVQLPFLCDFAAYARFLIALPLLLLAESIVDDRLRTGVQQFRRTALIEEAQVPQFDSALRQVSMLRDSALAEAVIVVAVGAGLALGISQEVSSQVSTWRSPHDGLVSLPGRYYAFVSIPIFQFLLYRWGWRLIIWFWFLYRTSRLNLRLIPTHPDLSGGLGFLGIVQLGFWAVVLSCSIVLAGVYADKIVYERASLGSFEFAISCMVILVLCVLLGPLLIYVPKLIFAKRQGLLDYGALGMEYTRSFDRKWNRTSSEEILGSSDIQSLADLFNSFTVITKMRVVPFGASAVLGLAAVTLAPMLLLLLLSKPIEDIFRMITSLASKVVR